jgi:hypothetical protein
LPKAGIEWAVGPETENRENVPKHFPPSSGTVRFHLQTKKIREIREIRGFPLPLQEFNFGFRVEITRAGGCR